MKEFMKLFNKYIIITIVSGLFGMPLIYIRNYFFLDNDQLFTTLGSISTYSNFAIKLILIVLLIIDFKKEDLKYIGLAVAATLFYPFMGVVMFAILYLLKKKEEKHAII